MTETDEPLKIMNDVVDNFSPASLPLSCKLVCDTPLYTDNIIKLDVVT